MSDLLTTDNRNEDDRPEGYTANKEDAQKIDDAINKFSNKNPSGKDAGAANKAPSGKDVGSSSLQPGEKPVPKGTSLGNAVKNGSGNMPNGAEVGNAAKDVGEAAAKGGEAMAKGGEAVAKGGEIAGKVGAGAAEGGTVAAEGGAAVVAGAPTAGIGAAVVVVISVATHAISAGAKAIKKAMDVMDNKKDASIGKIPTFILSCFFGLIIIICLLVVPVLTPAAAFAAGIDWLNEQIEGVESYAKGTVLSYTDKGKWFKSLYESLGIELSNKDLYDTINQTQLDENNSIIYKAIIDEAVYQSYRKYVKEFTHDPKIILEEVFQFFCFTGYSQKAALINLNNKPYYYALGDHTVSEILVDEPTIVNDDLNYAEIIAVFCQKEDNTYNTISYSEFYDKLVGNPESPHLFFEMELDENATYFYWKDKEHTEFETCTQAEAITHATSSQDNWISPSEYFEYKNASDETEDYSGYTILDSYTEASVDDDDTNFGWGYFYDFDLYPYGLYELYTSAGVNPEGDSYINPSFDNFKTLDIQEDFYRAYLGSSVPLGPSGSKERSDGNYKSIYNEKISGTCTGRSPMKWSSNSLTGKLSGFLGSIFSGTDGGMAIDYIPTGDSVIINIVEPYYFCQWGDDNSAKDLKRGDGRKTIGSSACIDCCYMWAAEYFNHEKYDISVISSSPPTGYVSGQSFQTSTFCNDFGIRFVNGEFSTQSIVSELTQGHLVEVQITGVWKGSTGATYHGDSPEHHFLIIGYDDTGFYLADPGSRSNTQHVIPYTDFSYCPVVSVRYLSSINDTTPDYAVNTIQDN